MATVDAWRLAVGGFRQAVWYNRDPEGAVAPGNARQVHQAVAVSGAWRHGGVRPAVTVQ